VKPDATGINEPDRQYRALDGITGRITALDHGRGVSMLTDLMM
jgi:hypothetical protein